MVRTSVDTLTESQRFIRFCFVGASAAIISYLVYVITLFLLADHVFQYDYVIANCCSFCISVLWSFYWQRKVVFQVSATKLALLFSLLKCYASYAISGIVLTNFFSFVIVEFLGISKYLALIIVMIVNVPINFILSKCWTFRK